MKIKELLSLVSDVARKRGISEPFIVGGLVRDKVLGKLNDINDIDITTGDEGSKILAVEVARYLKPANPNLGFKTFGDGHSSIEVGGIKLDFSSNYRSPEVRQALAKAGINNPTPMQMELFSRDFTCNTLLMPMDLSKIEDPTGMGMKDIKSRILRTPLRPEYTLKDNTKRVVRVLYLAAKLGFGVEPDIIRWVRANPSSIAAAKDQYVRNNLQKAFDYDDTKTVLLMDEMGLWRYAPVPKSMLPYATKYGRV